MPAGYATAVAIVALYTVFVLWPPRRPVGLARAIFFISHWLSEFPLIGLAALVATTVLALAGGDLGSTSGLVPLAVAAVTALGLLQIVRRGSLAGPAMQRSLERGLGPEWQSPPETAARWPAWRLVRDLVVPMPARPRNVELIRNIAYGPAGKPNRLDVYRRRGRPAGAAPVLVHFHGGHFQIGAKSREARALFHRLASDGWVCVSANYRLRAAGRFPRSLIDAKTVIAWVRSHADEYGADPSAIFVAGSSSGAHLASMIALTPNEPAFQPADEFVDTTVAAAVCLYGYYGERTAAANPPSSPRAYVTRDAPPFLVAHGDKDNQVSIGHAEAFVEHLRSASASPVVYVRLPGAQHTFDLLRSVRFDHVVDGIAAFAGWVRANR